jgi:hypothetical protein
MKKVLKIIGYVFLVFIILGIGSCFIISEKMPAGKEGPEAEALTDQMFEAINKEAWDSTRIVQWDFIGGHRYVWDKENDKLLVKWSDIEVYMDLDKYDGKVFKSGEEVSGDKKIKLFDKAFSFFCNDSFWLNAPVKARDEGTTRKLVNMESGEKGLLINYSSGGVTPGDSYLWILDETGQPKGWKMWVKILPVKGVYTSWEDWLTLDTGAKLSTLHGNKIFKMKIENIKSGQTYSELGIDDPFVNL